MKRDERNIEEVLERSLPSVSTEQMESARERIFNYVRSDVAVDRTADDDVDMNSARGFGWRLAAMTAVAALVAVAIWIGLGSQAPHEYARLETADGSMSRISEGKAIPVRAGEQIDAKEIVRSGSGGSTLVLSDGSRVEMRAQSELVLERATDGVRVRLNKGDVIVNAAKQHGHLYVQTKDVTVSVVGTVFFVKAEEAGSRVAVIEGEVRVQQGATEKKLHPGEQVQTNPLMEFQPVSHEIAWSGKAPEHMAMLQQTVVLTTFQKPLEGRTAFQEISIRPRPSVDGGGRGGPGLSVECALVPQIDPSRFYLKNANVYTLVAMAYIRGGCLIARELNLISGGPDWVRSDRYDVEAVMPTGSPKYTNGQLQTGEAPKLQKMIEILLQDRFNLSLRREMKAMQAYVLTSGPELKLKPWKVGDTVTDPDTGKEVERGCGVHRLPDQNGQTVSTSINCWNVNMAAFVNILEYATHRPVLDRTGIIGEFEFNVEFAESDYAGASPSALKSVSTAVHDQLGLELKASRESVEVLVIDRVERPSQN